MLKKLLMGLVKPLALKAVRKEGDAIQARLVKEVERRGPGAVDHLIDELQDRILMALQGMSWIPAWIKTPFVEAVQKHGDEVQARLVDAVSRGGPELLNKAFDEAQDFLEGKLRAL